MVRNLEHLKQAAPNPFLLDLVETAWSWRGQEQAIAKRPRSGLVNTITEVAPDPAAPSIPTQAVYWEKVLSRPKILVDIGEQASPTGLGGLARTPTGWVFKDFATSSDVASAIAGRLPASGGSTNSVAKWTSATTLGYGIAIDDGSTFAVAGEISTTSAIKMLGSGGGTYNTGAIFCDGAGIGIGRPRTSDSGAAPILSFYVNQRGGGTKVFEVGDGTTLHRQPVSSTSHLTLNGATRQSWGSGRNVLTLGGTVSMEQAHFSGDYWIVHNNCYFDGTNNRSISATGVCTQLSLAPDGSFNFDAFANNGANGVVTVANKLRVDLNGNGEFAGDLKIAGGSFRDDVFSSVGYALYPSGVVPGFTNSVFYYAKNGTLSAISGTVNSALAVNGNPIASASASGLSIPSLSGGGLVRAAPSTGLLEIAVRADLPGGPYLPLTAGIGERVTGALYLDNDFYLDDRIFHGNGDVFVRTGAVLLKFDTGFSWSQAAVWFPNISTDYAFRVDGGSQFNGTCDFTNVSAGIRTTDIKVGSALQRAPHFYTVSAVLPTLGVNEWCFLICDDTSASNLRWETNATQPVRVRSGGTLYTTNAGGNQVSDSSAINVNRTTCILIGPTDSGTDVCSFIPF